MKLFIATLLILSIYSLPSFSQSQNSAANQSEKIYTRDEVTQKPVIISAPEPTLTDEARRNCVEGTAVVRLVLSTSGKVEDIRVIKHLIKGKEVKELPYGLPKQAIKAASKIKFKPAMKDEKPVSMYFQIEYNFNPPYQCP